MSNSGLRSLELADLATVTGGAANYRANASSSTDQQMMMMMQTLASAIKDLQKPQDNGMMMALLPMLMSQQQG